MNVGLVTASISRSGGGVSEALRHLAASLAEVPCTNPIVYAVEDANTQVDLGLWGGVPLRTFASWGPPVFAYAPRMSSTLFADAIDVLHGHGFWTYSSTACRRWSGRVSHPYVISPHGTLDSWALRRSAWKKRIAARLYENRNLFGAACLHALNHSEAQSIRAYGLRNPIAVIPNGVDIQEGGAPSGSAPWTDLIEPGAKVLLFLGRINVKKGLANLLRAWQRLQSVASDWRLAIAGWDQQGHQRELAALSRELDLLDTVVFTGPLFGAAKQAALEHAAAFVLPSFSEGMPMAVLEAWAAGLPVVMTAECNLSEGFASGAALRVDCDVTGIEAGLRELFTCSAACLRKMGVRGRRLVHDHFSWPVVARQMSEMYHWVLGGGSPPQFVLTGNIN